MKIKYEDWNPRGTYYKIGAHDLPYMWVNDEWIRSNRDKAEIIRHIDNTGE